MFNSNLPKDFQIDIKYQPIKTESEKEFLRKMYEDPEFRKDWEIKNKQRWINDPDYGKKVGALISETYSTPEGRAVQAAKAHSQTVETIEKIKYARQFQVFDQIARDKMGKKKIGNNNRGRPIVTPLGIFASRKLASEAYLASGKLNAMKWIEKWLKTDSTNFYYISKEEYIMLTGKEYTE